MSSKLSGDRYLGIDMSLRPFLPVGLVVGDGAGEGAGKDMVVTAAEKRRKDHK